MVTLIVCIIGFCIIILLLGGFSITIGHGSGQDMKENLVCPFCGQGDFDKIGLKNHLELLKVKCTIDENIRKD